MRGKVVRIHTSRAHMATRPSGAKVWWLSDDAELPEDFVDKAGDSYQTVDSQSFDTIGILQDLS